MDDADRAQVLIERREAEREQEILERPPVTLPVGTPGNCELCDRWSGRLIGGACAPCRERYKLP